MDSPTASRLYNPDHLSCLRWFEDHAGKEVRFNELQADGIKLVTQFKGIFKPRWMPYVLSIRTTEQDRYSDGRIARQDDGSWHMSYAQEEDDRLDSRTLFTNRGIEACMKSSIPIGILRKERKADPYEVVGLGLPIKWQDRFFAFVSYQPGSAADLPGSSEAEAEQLAVGEIATYVIILDCSGAAETATAYPNSGLFVLFFQVRVSSTARASGSASPSRPEIGRDAGITAAGRCFIIAVPFTPALA